jgi:hypothetical protein
VTPPIQPRRPIFSKLATPQQVATLFPESPELVFNQDQKAPKPFMLPVGDQSQSVRDQADRWLGSSAPKPEAQDATAVARVEPIRTPPPPVKKKTPKRNAELRKLESPRSVSRSRLLMRFSPRSSKALPHPR